MAGTLGVIADLTKPQVYALARWVNARAPIIPEGQTVMTGAFADPVPQALVLTAIVIGFGVLAFSLVLAHRVHAMTGSDDIDEMGREN